MDFVETIKLYCNQDYYNFKKEYLISNIFQSFIENIAVESRKIHIENMFEMINKIVIYLHEEKLTNKQSGDITKNIIANNKTLFIDLLNYLNIRYRLLDKENMCNFKDEIKNYHIINNLLAGDYYIVIINKYGKKLPPILVDYKIII